MTTILNLSQTPNKVTIDEHVYNRLIAIEEAAREVVSGYFQSPGEMYIPDYIGEHISKLATLLDGEK